MRARHRWRHARSRGVFDSRGTSMTKEQQVALDAILREGGLDLGADAQTLRSAFEETMKQVPIAADVEQRRTTVGGVGTVEVTIRGADSPNVVLYFHGGV